MTLMLPTLSSDDEDEDDVGVIDNDSDDEKKEKEDESAETRNTTSDAAETKKRKRSKEEDDDEDEEEVEENEMDLMNDGFHSGFFENDDDDDMMLRNVRVRQTPWTYQSTSELLLAQNNTSSKIAVDVEPTEVSNIIAAARASLLEQQQQTKKGNKVKQRKNVDADDDSDSDSDSSSSSGKKEDNEEESSSSNEGSSNTSDSDSDDDDSSMEGDNDNQNVPSTTATKHLVEEDNVVLRTSNKTSNDASEKDAETSTKRSKGKEKKKKKDKGLQEDDDDDNERSDDDDSSDKEDDEEARLEAKKAAEFFDHDAESSLRLPSSSNVGAQTAFDGIGTTTEPTIQFSQLSLCRPLLCAVARMGYVTPTPVQRRCLPLALAGRDLCASAVTGSGKTAAFLLPVLEKIFQWKKVFAGSGLGSRNSRHSMANAACTRALILCPTRELAAQVLSMMTALTQFMKPEGFLTGCLIVGGAKNIPHQSQQLKARPDVVVATPGRLVDHLLNTTSFDLADIKFLILDEADRLLEMGFQDELKEIIKTCPKERQTLLFSATLDNTKIDDLIELSLKRPVRVAVSTKQKGGSATGTKSSSAESKSSAIEVAPRLEQEFVRIRSGNEAHREAIFLSLLSRSYANQRVICFFDTKVKAHRVRILAGLLGLQCQELHGDLTQQQRLDALEAFRCGDVNILFATDLAGRGIDIPNVDAVLNFEMPTQISTYVHRIGRTARAGRGGRSCTLISEGRRHLMKEVIKDAEEKNKQQEKLLSQAGGTSETSLPPTVAVIRTRTVPPGVVQHFDEQIKSLEPKVEEVKMAEKVAKLDRIAEMEAIRAQNIIEHHDEIHSRPKREWFVGDHTKQERLEAQKERERLREEKRKARGTHGMSRKKRRAYEARMAMMEAQREAREEANETGNSPKKHMTQEHMKTSAKAKKKQQQQRQKETHNKTISEDKSLRKFNQQTYSPRSEGNNNNVEKSAYHFREYDPNKKFGKGWRKGAQQFKSKKRYKRS